jgi:predicted outer membrane lipoprotein
MHLFNNVPRLHRTLLYGAYSWLLLSGLLHFGIDVVSQYIRGKRAPGPATTLYYGLNSSYAVGQILFAMLALFAIRQGVAAMGQWSGITLGLLAACSWFVLSIMFLEYTQPRKTVALFAVLLLGAALTV